MPKSAQKRPSAASKTANSNSMLIDTDHDYEDGMIHDLGNEEEFPSLPIVPTTPSKPPLAQKPSLSQTSVDKSDEIVTKLANLINTRSDALEEMVNATRAEMKDLKEKMGRIERRVEKSEQSTLSCMNRVTDLEQV